jgi:hypothetical protein
MKTYWTLWFGVMCLLLANEARLSAGHVLENPGLYGGGAMFAQSYHDYLGMSNVLTVVGVGLLLVGVAKSLLLRQAKESSGLLRVNK